MAFVIADRVKETTTTAGNGTVTLLGASAGYQSFAAVGNGNTTYYCIAGQTTSEWEVGIGTYTSSGTTLSRDTVLSSSNSGNKVVFSAGTKDVFVTYPSERAVTTDTTQTLTNKTLGSGSDWNGNAVPVSYGGTGASFFTTDIVPYYNGSTFNSSNIYYSSGNVGIVESAPTTLLDVGAYFGDPLRVSTSYSDVSVIWAYRQSGVRTNKFRISYDYTNTGFYIYDITNSATRLYINNSGDIGIGTTTPGNKLEVSGTFSASGVATFSAGTVTAPAITTSGDTNNGIYFPAADNVAITTGGTQRLLVDQFGSVGIGTSSPAVPLHVVGADATTQFRAGTTNAYFRVAAADSVYATSCLVDGANAVAAGFGSATNIPTVFYTNSNERMRIDTSGNVGIGTSSPSYSLDVYGSTNGIVSAAVRNASNGASAYGYLRVGNDTNADAGLLRNSSGNSAYGGANSLNLYQLGAYPLGFVTNNALRMLIDSSGNVGIGASPSATRGNLQVIQSGISGGNPASSGSTDANQFAAIGNTNVSLRLGLYASGGCWIQNSAISNYATNYDLVLQPNGGNVGIGTSSPTAYVGYRTTEVGDATTYGLFSAKSNNGNALMFCNAGVATFGSTAAYPTTFISQSVERVRISAAGGFSVGTTADPGAGAIYATGNITAYYSDDRLKTRLGKIENALDKVEQLNGFYYEANETAQELGYTAKREVGVSAQDVQAVLPEIVVPAPIDDKYLTIHYERLVPLLIEAIKELRAEVKALKEK